MRPGRPAQTRGVDSFEDLQLAGPRELLLDTSFVVEALIRTQPKHAACQAYLSRLIEDGSVVYFNRLLELELAEAAFKIALKEQFGRADPRYRRDGRVRRRAGRLMDAARRAWDETLAQMPFVCVELHEVHHAAPDLMRRFGLSSYDAVHAATAAYADIPIVTVDAGFSAVPASTLPMLTDAARVPWCPSNRARGSVTR